VGSIVVRRAQRSGETGGESGPSAPALRYWEQVSRQLCGFERDISAGAYEVYGHGMPAGSNDLSRAARGWARGGALAASPPPKKTSKSMFGDK